MGKKVILCVDDEKLVLDALLTQLRSALTDEFDFEIAESGEEALEVSKELIVHGREIVLVITDQLMPGMKGDQLLKELHRLSPETIKILLTGQATVEAVGRAVNQAALYHYISKPWEKMEMLKIVKDAIEKYKRTWQAKQRTAITEMFLATVNFISNEHKHEKLNRRIVEAIVRNTAADRTCLLLYDKHQDLICEAAYNTYTEIVISPYLFPEKILTDIVLSQQPQTIYQPALQSYLISDPYFQSFKPLAIHILPLVSNQKIIGALYLEIWQPDNKFKETELYFLQILIPFIIASIEKNKAYVALEEIAAQRAQTIRQEKLLTESQYREWNTCKNCIAILQQDYIADNEQYSYLFKDRFILYQKNENIAREFWWLRANEKSIFLALGSIELTVTGSGLISMIMMRLLDKLVIDYPAAAPEMLLAKLYQRLEIMLSESDLKSIIKAGIGIYDKSTQQFTYAHSRFPMYLVSKSKLVSINTQTIQVLTMEICLQQHCIEAGDLVFFFSEQVANDWVAPDANRFTTHRLAELVAKHQKQGCTAIYQQLLSAISYWKETENIINDILVLGLVPA
jgi:FixJ family two-component response regulator